MQKSNILIVDDDQDILKLISMRLVAAGYNTASASNGAEAMSAISLQRPDLVISDLRMPAMDGMALLEAVHNAHPNTASDYFNRARLDSRCGTRYAARRIWLFDQAFR